MEKNKFFDKNISESERKTIVSLIEIDDHGITRLVKKRLKDICKETELERSKQYKILKRLERERGIIEKKDIDYRVKPEYKELAYSSIIKDQMSNLENKGVFRFSSFTIFGIKDQKKWYEYPEIQHLHESLLESEYLLYRIKQIKAIFLVRDFIPIWKKFLKLEIHSAIKYELWNFSVNNLCFLHDNKDDFVDNQLQLLSQFIIDKKEEIDVFKNKIKRAHNDFLRELNSRKKKNKDYNGYNEKINHKILEHRKLYSRIMIDYMLQNLSKKELKSIFEIIDYIVNYYRKEINNVGIWTDLEKLSKGPMVLSNCWKKPYDKSEKDFRATNDWIALMQMQKRFKEIEKEKIDDKLKDFKDIYDDRNYDRLSSRLWYILANDIEKPKCVIFSNPRLEQIRKQIANLAREGGYPDYEHISSLMEKGFLKSDLDVFSFITDTHNISRNLYLIKTFSEKRNNK